MRSSSDEAGIQLPAVWPIYIPPRPKPGEEPGPEAPAAGDQE